LTRIEKLRYIEALRYDLGGSVSATLNAVECCAPLNAEVLSDEEAAATAELFRALADPARVRIVNLLATSEGDSVCICHLTEPLGLSQPTVSHHMKRLRDAGLVEREQRSKWAYFSLRDDAVQKLSRIVDLKGV
jgi:ArsR family transcriptional regulator, arsenate/arsenite/antimonite-responsive transcriptional repressor